MEAFCLSIATPHGPITLLTIYRPGSIKVPGLFFEELNGILEILITRNSQLVILGDFNLPLKEPSLPVSVRFLDLLSQFGLRQHINQPTHILGGHLDLVITSTDDQVDDLLVYPPTISDHSAITFTLPSIHLQPIHSIRMKRGWKSFDSQAFCAALRDTPLLSPDSTMDTLTVAELFDLYNSTVTRLLDTMLPRRKVWSRNRPLAVWFDADCHKLRRKTRCLERRSRRTKEPSDRLAWITQLRALHKFYNQKEAAHWEKLVARNSKDPKRLWSSISGLLGRSTRSTEIPSFTANDFLGMLTDKADRLRATTADASPPSFTTTSTVFDGFRTITESDLRLVFKSVNLKSCELDPLPPFIINDMFDDFAPFLLYMFNRSLSEGCIPSSQKRALVFPSLKKPNLDTNLCLNYRPISNLSFLSKTLERLVSLQLLPYLEKSGLLPANQSGFRTNHSTETALLSLLSEIYSAVDRSELTLLALYDVSSAFDMVDHEILLQRLETSFGLKGTPLTWFRSYLSDRTQMIITGDSRTLWTRVKFGVPQGSVLGPLLFILFTADISSLFPSCDAAGHLFADDVQAFVHGPPSDQLFTVAKIQSLSDRLHSWMTSNRLSLNASKTQLIWFGTQPQLQKLDFSILSEHFPLLSFSSSVRDLGVVLDTTLTFKDHIANLSRSSYFHLRRLRVIRRSVSSSIFTTLVHAFVCSRIDYCNSLLVGLPKASLSPLQSVLNSAARLIARLPKYSPISTFMFHDLHWLPLHARMQFKILTLMFKAQLGLAPKYLINMISRPYSASSLRPLRSANRHDLFVPFTRTTMAQSRSFASVGPSLWNALSPCFRSEILSGRLSSSLSHLKTCLFSRGLAHWKRF
jgi:Reverse transcriptase (RNA-dependent DNA polymerase)